MQLDRPFLAVTPTVDGDVLSVLARASASFTPPQVHRVIGHRSEAGVRRALVRLTEQGIVTAERVGNAMRYELNRDHLAAAAITTIARIREMLIARLREHIRAWSVPTPYAALFGSAARGSMSPSSDIDLFVVRASSIDREHDTWTDQIHELGLVVRTWTGNDAQVLEYEEADLPRTPPDLVVDEIMRDGIALTDPGDYLRQQLRSV